MNNIEQKLEQYETTAVSVANDMRNDQVRAENSKEIIENFPNVRLASEKQASNKVGRGKAFLSSLLLSTAIGACCFGTGYKTNDYLTPPRTETKQENVAVSAQLTAALATPQEKAIFKRTIEDIINKDLGERGLVFLGNFNDFAVEYGTKLLGKKPDIQQQQAISEYLQNRAQPVQAHKIDGTNSRGESGSIYRFSWR